MSVCDFLESSRAIEKKPNTTNLSLSLFISYLSCCCCRLWKKRGKKNPDNEDVDDEETEEKRP